MSDLTMPALCPWCNELFTSAAVRDRHQQDARDDIAAECAARKEDG